MRKWGTWKKQENQEREREKWQERATEIDRQIEIDRQKEENSLKFSFIQDEVFDSYHFSGSIQPLIPSQYFRYIGLFLECQSFCFWSVSLFYLHDNSLLGCLHQIVTNCLLCIARLSALKELPINISCLLALHETPRDTARLFEYCRNVFLLHNNKLPQHKTREKNARGIILLGTFMFVGLNFDKVCLMM